MANDRSGNTRYVTATGIIDSGNIRISGIVVTATAANAIVTLTDEEGETTKLQLRVATSGESQYFDFTSSPLYFPTGIRVSALTNANMTLIYNT